MSDPLTEAEVNLAHGLGAFFRARAPFVDYTPVAHEAAQDPATRDEDGTEPS